MEEKFIEQMLKKSIESIVINKIEEELEQEVKKFAYKLESRKDEYIAEVMKGIRIYHERDAGTLSCHIRP